MGNTGGAASGGRVGTGGANTGGAATGGKGTGGANTGGANTGGAATGGRGTGGAGTGGRTTGPQPDCTKDADCHLVNNCCNCEAIGPNQPEPPLCGLVCIQSKCMAQGLPANKVACVAGRCVAGFNCDSSTVTCRMAPPNCNNGQVPSINADGNCYTGSCVIATQCTSVDNCNACSNAQACVTYQTRSGQERHCVTVPAACNNNTNCNCLGDTTCLSPYTTCNNASGDSISCSCPTC